MIPAAESFSPFFLTAGAIRLRAARFGAAAVKGVCLILNGQTEFIEKYFEVIDEWRVRGFSVVTFDWRGQGGSDRLLSDPRKAHIDDFAAYDQDLDAVIHDIVQPMMAEGRYLTKPVVLAHSMGGNVLLRRLHNVQGEFATAILSAPMLGIQPRGVPWWLVERIAAAINRNGPSTDFVWGMAARDQLKLPFALQIVTSDPNRYARSQAILKAHPDLRLNGPTWGWLDAALRAIELTRESGYAEAIKTKALLIAAGHDRVCDSAAVRAFAMRMPEAEFVEIKDAQHEIMMERDPLRAQWWSEVDAFLKKNAPAVSR